MKKLLLTITMAVGGFAGLAPSAQAWCHPAYHCGYHGCGYHWGGGYHCGGGYNYCYHGGRYGYWYWNNGCRFFRVVVVPGPVPPPWAY